MNKYILGIIYYFLLVVIALFFVPQVRDDSTVTNYLYLSFTGLSVLTGVIALKTVGANGGRGNSLLLSVLGAISWFIGEAWWAIDYVRLGEVPFPSGGDLFFLFGYIFFFVCLLIEIRLANFTFRSVNKQIIGISLIVALLSIGSFVYFTSALSFSGESPLWENIVTMGYGLGDIILIITSVFLIQLIWIYRGGKMSLVWHFLLVGFILITIADYLYGIYFELYEVNVQPLTNIVNSIYIAGYASIAIHYIRLQEIIKQIQQKALPKTKNK